MSQRKPRAPKRRIEGTYPIDTGEAAIVPDPDRDGGYTLEVNRVPSSYVVPGAPEVLAFDYMHWMAGFVQSTPGDLGMAVHLGAAGCALPSYFAHRFGNRNVAVEVDGALAKLVRWAFDPDVEIAVAEARAFTHALPAGSVHVLIRDVFSGPDTPRPLTTVEFYRAAHRALAPSGIFLANVGDAAGLRRTRTELAGLAQVFRHTAAVGPADMLAGRAYGNVVIAASDRPLVFRGGVPCKDGALLIDAHLPPLHDSHRASSAPTPV